MIILLDLNYTLVANQLETRGLRPFSRRIEAEAYRGWLIEAVRPHRVILLTARPAYQKTETLQSIERKTGWKPEFSIFNTLNLRPEDHKERALLSEIFPRFSGDPDAYLAIESNPRSRERFARHGVRSVWVDMPYQEVCQWTRKLNPKAPLPPTPTPPASGTGQMGFGDLTEA